MLSPSALNHLTCLPTNGSETVSRLGSSSFSLLEVWFTQWYLNVRPRPTYSNCWELRKYYLKLKLKSFILKQEVLCPRLIIFPNSLLTPPPPPFSTIIPLDKSFTQKLFHLAASPSAPPLPPQLLSPRCFPVSKVLIHPWREKPGVPLSDWGHRWLWTTAVQ